MKILAKYVLKEFLKPFFFSSFAFGGLVLVSEFFRELSYYLEKSASFIAVFEYLFLNFPWWIVQVLPVAVLLAVLFSLGQLARQGEITAMKAAGINLWKLIFFMLAIGFAIGMSEFFLRENVIPVTVRKADFIRKTLIQKERITVEDVFHDVVIVLPDHGRMTVGTLDASHSSMSKIVIDYYNDSFNIQRQLVAGSAAFADGSWTLKTAVERFYKNDSWTENNRDLVQISLPFKPGDFIIERKRPEQMSTKEYITYIARLKTLGIPVEKDMIQFHLRWSSIFSHIVVMLIGIPFALGLGSRHGKIISFTFALIFSFLYWGLQAMGQSFGENRVISPFAAAWLGNFVFGTAGIYLAGKIKK